MVMGSTASRSNRRNNISETPNIFCHTSSKMFETILTLDFRKWNLPNLLKIDPGLEIWWGTDFISSFSPQRLESWGGSDKGFLWSLLVKKAHLTFFAEFGLNKCHQTHLVSVRGSALQRGSIRASHPDGSGSKTFLEKFAFLDVVEIYRQQCPV